MRRLFMLSGIACAISFPIYAPAMTLSASDFFNGGSIPSQYSCDGKDISPALTWSEVPTNTQSLALILSDPDAPGGTFYHWIVFNIPKTTPGLPQAVRQLPAGALVGENSWRQQQYRGPCPPKGATHHYIFSLYALDTKLTLPAGSNAMSVIDAIQNHVVDETELKATFGH